MRRQGMTLIEMLVACALFMVFITLSGGLIVQMLQSYRQGEEIVRPIQNARNAMGLMSSTIRSAITIVSPPPLQLAKGSEMITVEIYTDATRHVKFERLADETVRYYELFPDGTVKSERPLLKYSSRLNFRKQPVDPFVIIELDTVVGVTPPTPFGLQTMILLRMPSAR